jgi:hypothetical protein
MFKPWSTIDDEELRLLRETAEKALELGRGCDCEYDYRCGRCEQVLSVKELARKALQR